MKMPIKRVPITAEAPLMWQKHDLKNVACNFFVMENRGVEKPKGIQIEGPSYRHSEDRQGHGTLG